MGRRRGLKDAPIRRFVIDMTATAFVTPPRKFMVFYGFGLFIAGYCIWFMRDDVVVGGARRNSFVGEIGDRIFGGVFFDFRATRNSCPRQRFVTVLVAGSGMDGFFEHHHKRVSLSSRLPNSKPEKVISNCSDDDSKERG